MSTSSTFLASTRVNFLFTNKSLFWAFQRITFPLWHTERFPNIVKHPSKTFLAVCSAQFHFMTKIHFRLYFKSSEVPSNEKRPLNDLRFHGFTCFVQVGGRFTPQFGVVFEKISAELECINRIAEANLHVLTYFSQYRLKA